MNKTTLFTVIAIIVTGGIITATSLYVINRQGTPQPTKPPTVYNTQIVDSKTSQVEGANTERLPSPLPAGRVQLADTGNAAIGTENLKLLMVEFTDYQCPICADFHNKYFDQIKKEYIVTGKMRYVIKDFPLFAHENAKPAALYTQCVHDVDGTDNFFKYIKFLFANQGEWSESIAPAEYFSVLAKELKLNQSAIDTCFVNKASEANVTADRAEGDSLGVNGTPIFFLNGRVLVGSPPTYDDLKKILEEELTE